MNRGDSQGQNAGGCKDTDNTFYHWFSPCGCDSSLIGLNIPWKGTTSRFPMTFHKNVKTYSHGDLGDHIGQREHREIQTWNQSKVGVIQGPEAKIKDKHQFRKHDLC